MTPQALRGNFLRTRVPSTISTRMSPLLARAPTASTDLWVYRVAGGLRRQRLVAVGADGLIRLLRVQGKRATVRAALALAGQKPPFITRAELRRMEALPPPPPGSPRPRPRMRSGGLGGVCNHQAWARPTTAGATQGPSSPGGGPAGGPGIQALGGLR